MFTTIIKRSHPDAFQFVNKLVVSPASEVTAAIASRNSASLRRHQDNTTTSLPNKNQQIKPAISATSVRHQLSKIDFFVRIRLLSLLRVSANISLRRRLSHQSLPEGH